MYTIHLVSYRYCYRLTSPSLYVKLSRREPTSQSAQNVERNLQAIERKSHFWFRASQTTTFQFYLSSSLLRMQLSVFPSICNLTLLTTAAPFAACSARRRLSALYFQPMKLIGQAHLSRVCGKYKLCAMCMHSCMHDKLMPRRGLFVTVDTSILY